MKIIIGSILILLLSGLVHATNFSVGGKDLEIPAPNDFSLVTKEMDAVYRLGLRMADPMNDQLAFYIVDSDVPIAMSGEMPSFNRYYLLKVNKKLKNRVVGSKDFAVLKTSVKSQNTELIKSVEKQMPGLMEKISNGISEEFDIDFAMKLSQVVPLNPHSESDCSFAYSMYVNYGTTIEGSTEDIIVSATSTIVNVAGKIIFLYCYGPQEELEWTRSASKAWEAMILASNAQPPLRSSGMGAFDWNKVLEKSAGGAVVGAVVGCLGVLVLAIILKNKKRANRK